MIAVTGQDARMRGSGNDRKRTTAVRDRPIPNRDRSNSEQNRSAPGRRGGETMRRLTDAEGRR
ncbi:hypothetical protein EA473_20890 [Natrarchaeobius chitinivorans]|uniref:Uncharacterized protein n=1 Tax=Natrarchaeobius chitinivorans TaxID=1679083 RepID=A0A3N6NZQ4_NATCH|nr:hypothetical protein EA473_20890 [Natrarchaeobius chitinivorans]